MPLFLLTTEPGIEDVVVAELGEVCPGCPARGTRGGHVVAELDGSDALLRLRTIHHVVELRWEGRAETLEAIRDAVGRAEFPELAGAESFRVTSERQGRHSFSSVDIQRVAGGVLHLRYGTPVDLEGYRFNVRVDLCDDQLVVGLQRTRRSLGNRIRRSRPLRSSIKPTLAAAMLRLAGAHRGEGLLIDPMCGAGTIPIEARTVNPALGVRASDWDGETVEVARGTIANHGLEIEVAHADARNLGEECPERYDYIVTDPPYGVRQARRTSLHRLYASLLPSFEKALKPGGTLALVVLKYHAFLPALERTSLVEAHRRVIDLGGLYPRIFLLRKPPCPA